MEAGWLPTSSIGSIMSDDDDVSDLCSLQVWNVILSIPSSLNHCFYLYKRSGGGGRREPKDPKRKIYNKIKIKRREAVNVLWYHYHPPVRFPDGSWETFTAEIIIHPWGSRLIVLSCKQGSWGLGTDPHVLLKQKREISFFFSFSNLDDEVPPPFSFFGKTEKVHCGLMETNRPP